MSVAEVDPRSLDAGQPHNASEANASVEGRGALRSGGPETTAEQRVAREKPTNEDQGDETSGHDKSKGSLREGFRKHPIAFFVSGGLLIAGIIAGVAWWLHARHFETTDDAFIDGRPVLISPQITGNIVTVNVTDNQIIKAGELLATIDPRDYKAAADEAAAQIRQAEASVANLDAQLKEQEAAIEQAAKQVVGAQAAFNFAQDENTRYQDLVQKGAGTVQRAQQATSDFDSKRASLDGANAAEISAKRRVGVLQAQRASSVAQVDQAKAEKARADANLSRTELRATVDGRVAKLTAAVGALASPGQSIMIVVPLDVWVTANFKESQLRDMKVGQPVDISIDAYQRTFPGHVNSVQAGSGTAFSLLPAENATGNYVKVVQRVPVKLTFDQRPDVQLGPGMSVVPRVTVRP